MKTLKGFLKCLVTDINPPQTGIWCVCVCVAFGVVHLFQRGIESQNIFI